TSSLSFEAFETNAIADALSNTKDFTTTLFHGRVDWSAFSRKKITTRQSCYRNGLIFWESCKPAAIHIVHDKDPGGLRADIPIPTPDRWGWPFEVSDDTSLLVTQTATDTFQLWSVKFPKVQLLQECRLTFDAKTESPTLV